MTYADVSRRATIPPKSRSLTMPLPKNLADMPPEREEVCRIFGLGTPFSDWAKVVGGRSHSMWSLTTATGRYAVKVFDQTVDHTRSTDWKELFKDAVALELAAWRAGLPLPRPVPVAGADKTELLAEASVDGSAVTLRVHEWVDAEPVPDDIAEPDLAAAIGGVLADLHRLAVPTRHEQAIGLWHTHSDDYLTGLAERARLRGYAWAGEFDRARAAYQTVRELVELRHRRTWPLITTHRDLGPNNVLLMAAHTPVVVDWDVAGPWTAVEETAAAAVEWAGALTGSPHREATRALISGYRASGGTLVIPGPEVFAGWLVKHANWTEMHIRHALDDTLPEYRRHTADQAVPELIEQLERFAAGTPSWTRWLLSWP
jgi:hypothetical protein